MQRKEVRVIEVALKEAVISDDGIQHQKRKTFDEGGRYGLRAAAPNVGKDRRARPGWSASWCLKPW